MSLSILAAVHPVSHHAIHDAPQPCDTEYKANCYEYETRASAYILNVFCVFAMTVKLKRDYFTVHIEAIGFSKRNTLCVLSRTAQSLNICCMKFGAGRVDASVQVLCT